MSFASKPVSRDTKTAGDAALLATPDRKTINDVQPRTEKRDILYRSNRTDDGTVSFRASATSDNTANMSVRMENVAAPRKMNYKMMVSQNSLNRPPLSVFSFIGDTIAPVISRIGYVRRRLKCACIPTLVYTRSWKT